MPSNLAGAPEIQPYDAADPVPKVDSPVPWRRHGPLYLLRKGSCPLRCLAMCSSDKIRRHWPQTSGPPTISELGQLKGWQVSKGDSIPRPWEFTGPLCCGRMPSVGNKILRATGVERLQSLGRFCPQCFGCGSVRPSTGLYESEVV